MTNVIIFHGTGNSPEMHWYPYIKNHLEKRGYSVWVPALPHSDESRLEEWLPFVLENGDINEDTILIGHSAGGPLILSILEKINVKIKQAILVAGFLHLTSSNILQKSYDWEKIRSNVEDVVFIHSDDDPWGCNDVQGREFFDRLGGMLVILQGQGHMGSAKFNQPYLEFPLLLRLIR